MLSVIDQIVNPRQTLLPEGEQIMNMNEYEQIEQIMFSLIEKF